MRRTGLLDLNEAVQNPGKRLQFEVNTVLASEEDLDLVEAVTGTLEAVSTGNALLLKGDFRAKIVLECARCTEPLTLDLPFTMEDEFEVEGIPSSYASDSYAQVVCDEIYQLFDKNALHQDTYIRQGLIVSLPLQPICSFGWDGNCPNAKPELFMSGDEPHGRPEMLKLEQFRTADEGKE